MGSVKYKMSLRILAMLLLGYFHPAIAQDEKLEIYIIGTMHQVPKIVQNSYKPLLRNAVKYAPQAIFVENPTAEDTISWEYLKNGWSSAYKQFSMMSDSAKQHTDFDKQQHERLLSIDTHLLSEVDLTTLMQGFVYLRDFANYDYYRYIRRYGINGSKKALGHEDDLSFKLALQLGMKKVYAMDDQQTNKQYHQAWQACMRDGAKNGDNKINRRLNRKDYIASVFPALLGRLGKHNNSKGALMRMHQLNSYRYVKHNTDACSLGTKYWDERNYRIAQNILAQVRSAQTSKNLVVIGAGHVIGLREALLALGADFRIKTMYQL